MGLTYRSLAPLWPQTGTGKSHTMEGKDEPPELRGIIPNTFDYIFTEIGSRSECLAPRAARAPPAHTPRRSTHDARHSPSPRSARAGGEKEYLVRASYLEIYNEDIRDLLSKNPTNKLELKESPDKGVYVKDLMQFVVKSVAEINSVLHVSAAAHTPPTFAIPPPPHTNASLCSRRREARSRLPSASDGECACAGAPTCVPAAARCVLCVGPQVGKKNRSVGATQMNQDSSRSHSIFTVTIETIEKYDAKAAQAVGAKKDDSHIRVGKLNLVDLAGSERQSKTGATGERSTGRAWRAAGRQGHTKRAIDCHAGERHPTTGRKSACPIKSEGMA